eukprot:CAMPEP_0185607710 /NCGR_PEP_ID=MMETSP0436-20130131/5703_1 /TAXON_ID=626734 ORGANISM="Favella taraikaensis, Strain Fe Narragansett Bay" /NCGR_SAMPLE_ID=MMETSP0436 /ASSEMBLY_ACC=CAM_ASM_000390 /LENGTH=112 /DNA_ID=CAMNT_0028239733 /DNA_START=362 /DNA_END=699 /DNA_ORIENTATION=+
MGPEGPVGPVRPVGRMGPEGRMILEGPEGPVGPVGPVGPEGALFWGWKGHRDGQDDRGHQDGWGHQDDLGGRGVSQVLLFWEQARQFVCLEVIKHFTKEAVELGVLLDVTHA